MNSPSNDDNLISLLETDWFGTLLLPYLSFGDLRNLYQSNKVAMPVVSSLTATWPVEIRELNRIWCKKPGESLFIVHPSGIIRFQVDGLSYDTKLEILRGQPWSEVVAKNELPSWIGGNYCGTCYANDANTQIFFYNGLTSDAGIFDTESCLWTELPNGPTVSYFNRVFRIGNKVYILCANGTIDSFDLENERWEDSLLGGMSIFHGDGNDIFHENGIVGLCVIVVNGNTVILAGGHIYDEDIDEYLHLREVYSFNIISGEKTRLPDMSEEFCGDNRPYYFACMNNGTLFVMNDENWATLSIDRDLNMNRGRLNDDWNWSTLSQGGEWQINPNLQGRGLKAIHLNNSMCKVFAGNTWIDLPPYNEPGSDGLHVNGMKIDWTVSSNHRIVK